MVPIGKSNVLNELLPATSDTPHSPFTEVRGRAWRQVFPSPLYETRSLFCHRCWVCLPRCSQTLVSASHLTLLSPWQFFTMMNVAVATSQDSKWFFSNSLKKSNKACSEQCFHSMSALGTGCDKSVFLSQSNKKDLTATHCLLLCSFAVRKRLPQLCEQYILYKLPSMRHSA